MHKFKLRNKGDFIQFIRATALFISLEFSVATIFYGLFYSGAMEAIKLGLIDNVGPGFTHYSLFTTVSSATYWGLIGVAVGLIPAYFLYAVKKEAIEYIR